MEGIWRQWWRLGGAAGIIFVILFVIGIFGLQFDAPAYDDSIDDIRAYWVDDGQQYLAGDYLAGIGFIFFFLPFLVSLRALLERAEGSVSLWSRVAFLAAVVLIIWGAAAGFFWGALASGDFAAQASDETLKTLMQLDYYAFNGLPLAMAIFVLASSLVIIRTGVLWTWLAYLGVVEGIVAVLAPLAVFSTSSDSFFAILGYVAFTVIIIWILLVSIAMLMRKEEPAAAI